MIMLKNEKNAKAAIMRFLAEQGYPRYASLLRYFDVNLTSDPDTIAYVENDRARIVINKYLSLEQVSVVVRHELLHRWLRHAYRAEKHLGKDVWDKRTYQDHQLFNIAADYEISNRGYTDEDKDMVRKLALNDPSLSKEEQIKRGLVTEDDHPEWVDLPMEDMLDKLQEMRKNNEEVLRKFLDELEKRGFFDQDDTQESPGSSSSSQQGNSQQQNNNQDPESSSNDNSSDTEGEENDSENSKDGQSTSSSSRKKQSKTIRDLEDIKRALEKRKENTSKQEDSNSSSSQSSSKEEQDNKSTEDKLTDLIDDVIDQIKDSNLSDEEKDKKTKELADKLKDVLDNQEDKPDPEDASKDTQKKLDELAKKIEKEAAEQEKELSNTDLDRSTIDQDLQSRIDSIEDILNDANELESTLRDTEKKNFKDNKTKKEKTAEVDKYSSSNYSKELFLEELDRLIKSQIDRVREPTYNYPSRKRVFGSNIIFQGQKWQYSRVKPRVIVYYDRSGSWQVDWKTKAGDDAIAMLNENYVRKNLIELEVRYFADTVGDSPTKVGGGNDATQEILDDIVEQRATNVILMTDSDIDYPGYSRKVEVPGGVFFLFVDGESPIITKYLYGKQMTKVYKIVSKNNRY